MRFRALVAVVGVLLAAMTVNALAASQVKSVRLWRAPDNTRLVFDLSGPVQHSVFTLTAPDRLVIDINGATLAAPLKVSTANTPITAMRSAQRTPTDLRVVIDLKKVVTPKSFSLAPNAQYGNRLVVDLFDNPADAAPAPAPAPSVATTPAVPVSPAQPQVKLPPLPPAPAGKRDVIVVIDAGHGGEDPGASGSRGQHEKDVVLAIARELQRQINGMKGYRAELTRTGDYFIPLRGRTEIARKKGADLFVSIHADAAPSKAAFGASVFALSDRGATSETARWLADSENRSDLIGGAGNVSLDDKDRMLAGVLLDLSMTASLTSSLNVGQKVLTNMGRVTPLHKQRWSRPGLWCSSRRISRRSWSKPALSPTPTKPTSWPAPATSRRWRAPSVPACVSSSSRTRRRAPISPGYGTPGKSPRARVITGCSPATPWPCWPCVSRFRPPPCAAPIT
jgi:N-acetylmuramoyl-L-alanine amidase